MAYIRQGPLANNMPEATQPPMRLRTKHALRGRWKLFNATIAVLLSLKASELCTLQDVPGQQQQRPQHQQQQQQPGFVPTSHGMSYSSRPSQMGQPVSMDAEMLSQQFQATSVPSNASDYSVSLLCQPSACSTAPGAVAAYSECVTTEL